MTAKKKQSANPAYYMIDADYIRGGAPWLEILNRKTLKGNGHGLTLCIWPDGYLQLPRGPWLFRDFVETPRLLFDKKLGRPPRDLENESGVWVVSAAMKAVLEAVDPAACDFRPCETVLPSGEPGRETWLCTVTRAFVGAVDQDASEFLLVRQGVNGLPAYGVYNLTKLQLKQDVIGGAHLFRIAEMAGAVYCDQAMKDACKAAGVKGVLFRQFTK